MLTLCVLLTPLCSNGALSHHLWSLPDPTASSGPAQNTRWPLHGNPGETMIPHHPVHSLYRYNYTQAIT